jgi:hypothetical protein
MKIRRFNESFSNDFDKECEYIISSIEDFCSSIIQKEKFFYKHNLSSWDNYTDIPDFKNLFRYHEEDEPRYFYIGYEVMFKVDFLKKLVDDNSNIEISDMYNDFDDFNSMLYFLNEQVKRDSDIKININFHQDREPIGKYFTLNIINTKEKIYED